MSAGQRLSIFERLALLSEKRGATDEADRYFGQGLAEAEDGGVPDSATISFLRKYLEFAQRVGRPEAANDAMRRLIDRLSASPETYEWVMQLRYTLAVNLTQSGDETGAMAIYAAAVEQHKALPAQPYSPVVHSLFLGYAELAFKSENYELAESLLKLALDLEAESPNGTDTRTPGSEDDS